MATTAKPAGSGESRSFAPAETPHRLLAGERPHGAAVLDRTGERIGSIEDVAIDEATGKVAYAVLRYGGFLGMRRRCRPVPWSLLAYDARLDVYVTRMDRASVERGPTFGADVLRARDDRAYRDKVHGYYAKHGAAPYWI
jgi:hypothetical protein